VTGELLDDGRAEREHAHGQRLMVYSRVPVMIPSSTALFSTDLSCGG
jgi:hypothetical protein